MNERKYFWKPGDLVVARDPAGTLRLCERVGEDTAGFGDVTFTYAPAASGHLFAECRDAGIDRLIGRPFRSFNAARRAIREASPTCESRFKAIQAERGFWGPKV